MVSLLIEELISHTHQGFQGFFLFIKVATQLGRFLQVGFTRPALRGAAPTGSTLGSIRRLNQVFQVAQ